MVGQQAYAVPVDSTAYENFAAEQSAKKQQIISSYEAEIKALINNAEKAGKNAQTLKIVRGLNNDNNLSIVPSNITPLPVGCDIIIFISFSMPKQSIKDWLFEADKIGANVVMRGLINNSFKDTIGAIYDLIKYNQVQGIAIDPTLFKKFHINKVPAVVVVDSFDNYDVVYGDVTLDYALRAIAHHGEVEKNQVQKELAKLRGKNE